MSETPLANEAELKERIQSGFQDADAFIDLASDLFLQHRYEEALALLRSAPTDAFPPVQKARIFIQYGGYLRDVLRQLDEAAACAERSIALLQSEPDSLEIIAWRGCSRAFYASVLAETDPVAAKREAAKALSDLERVAAESSELDILEPVLSNAGRMCLLMEHAQLVEYSEKYLRLDLDPRSRVSGLANLGLAYSVSGRLQEAEIKLAEAVQ